jgi:curved DNA-binding protein CbpA
MSPSADPWKTLGLSPGAAPDEIRRAYRALAKSNHPDAAGEAALPRFLAIQSAYEQLLASAAPRRPGSRPASARSKPTEPWRADPDRARATGRADRRRPGARPQPTDAPPAGSTGRAGRQTGTAPGAGADDPAAGPRPRRPSSRRRAPNKATPYSTSYDRADDEPFEPGWSGGTWYGASSGTYWTINPKEYADPRKHGPEYQRRAHRLANGQIGDPGSEAPADPTTASDAASAADAGAQAPDRAAATGPGAPEAATWTDARAGPPTADRSARPSGAWARPATSPSRRDRTAGRRSTQRDRPAAGSPRRFGGPVLPYPTTPVGRLIAALAGWPPVGLVVAGVIGEETGCGRFAASCGDLAAPGTWIVQAAIVLLLLAIPTLARWFAHGTIATVAAGIPAAIVLSAGGASSRPDTSSAMLGVVLVVAFVVGVAYAVGASAVERAGRDDGETRGGTISGGTTSGGPTAGSA